MNPHYDEQQHKNDGITSGLCFILCIAIMGAVALSSCEARAATVDKKTEGLLYAIFLHESVGTLTPKDGDGGKAIGPYQIWWVYWKDAVDHDPSIGGTYQDCRDIDYARRIVIAYFDRYGKGLTLKQLARLHNGGPGWRKKPATIGYWHKVRQYLPVHAERAVRCRPSYDSGGGSLIAIVAGRRFFFIGGGYVSNN